MASLYQESIEITAADDEEALVQAAALTGGSPADLEVVRSERVFRFPWQPRRSRFWITPRQSRESLDGLWSVDYGDGSVWLTVYPSKGAGRPVMPEEVLEARRAWPVASVDPDRLFAVIENAAGQPRAVAEYETPADVPFLGLVSPNQMAGYLVLGVSWSGSEPLSHALAALGEAGMVYGVDIDRVRVALIEGQPGKAIVVAEGTPAVPGEDARLFGASSPAAPRVGKDGSIDFSFSRLTGALGVGEPLLVMEPATFGMEGTTVLGTSIPTLSGRPIDLSALVGEGVSLSEDGLQIIATIAGTPSRVAAGKINVLPLLDLPRGVDLTTGNINFPGNVIVRADVATGFSVRAAGDITVGGVALGAVLEAGGAVVLQNGMFGQGVGAIAAGGYVQAGFLREATVQSAGDVLVSGEIVRCSVTAGERVVASGAGRVIGGVIQAGHAISVGVVGTPSGTMTRLIVQPLKDETGAGEQGEAVRSREEPRPFIRVHDRVYAPTQISIGDAKRDIDTETPFCRFTEADGVVVESAYS